MLNITNMKIEDIPSDLTDEEIKRISDEISARCNHDAKMILDFKEDNIVMEVWGDVNPYELAIKGTEAAAVIISRIADGLIELEENKKDFQKLLLERVVALLEEEKGETDE